MLSTEQFFSVLESFQYLCVAAETLLVHDYFLTFSLELDHIWHSRWSTVKVLFLLSRYVSLVGQSVYTLAMLGVLSHRSSKFCPRFEGFAIFFGLFQAEVIRILVLLRAWAIWGCQRYVAVLLISAYVVHLSVISGMLVWGLVLLGSAELPFIYLAKTGVCLYQGIDTKADHSWVIPMTSILLDAIVFFMVTISLGKLFKETQCLQHPRPLLRTLATDAALYLAASVVTSAIGIMAQFVFSNNLLSNIQITLDPLVTVTGQRVILNLRSMQSLPYSQQVFDLNLITDSSLLSRSAEDSHRALDSDPLAQQDLDYRDHATASGIEMVDIPVNRSGGLFPEDGI